MSARGIKTIDAWEALDSRGTPTVACQVTLRGGAHGTATVPSGASTGRYEAQELRDGGSRYDGRGVLRAVDNILRVLAPAVHGIDAHDQRAVDDCLRQTDGTVNLARLGANATLAVSMATARAAAAAVGQPLWRVLAGEDDPLLPLPMVNIISGGAHAGGLIDIQDLLAVPLGAATFTEALEWISRVRRHTAVLAADIGLPTALVADEGGIAGALPSNQAALELLTRGIEASGLRAGDDIGIAIDVAATQLLTGDGHYHLRAEHRSLTADDLIEELLAWTGRYPIVSLEDVLADDDWPCWRSATATLGGVQLIGDDLFATDPRRLRTGINAGAANAVLIKVNQNGTLTGAADVLRGAQQAGYATVVSARSGDTEDSWLADLAVGWRAGQIKVGSTTRSERTAKWNRLLYLEHQLGSRAAYAGRTPLAATTHGRPDTADTSTEGHS